MGPGPHPSEIARGVKAALAPRIRGACRNSAVIDSTPGPPYDSAQAGVMKWQTCQTQNLVGGNARVGSSPTAGKEPKRAQSGPERQYVLMTGMVRIQVLGENELLHKITKGQTIGSHCISIRNPDMEMPDSIPSAFKKIIELKFLDVLEGQQAPQEEDAQRIVRFVTETQKEATGYTIHCWGGHSRSTAAALAVVYMFLGDEEKSARHLLKIRRDPKPSPNLTFLGHFDRLLGSNLVAVGKLLQAEFVEQLSRELAEFFPGASNSSER